MNLSISASDHTSAAAWRLWLLQFVGVTAATTLVLLAFIVLLDPFSTGRLTPLDRIDYVTNNRLYNNVARVRDPRFDAAIFGNSHAVRIATPELDRATGRRFAMLAIEGTWPDEHLSLLQTFDRLHRAAVIVVVLDDQWCSPTREKGYVLPQWLYQRETSAYLAHILSPFSLRIAWQRLLVLTGLAIGQRPDGYDPAPWMPWNRAQLQQRMQAMPLPVEAADATAPFPYLDRLKTSLAQLDPHASVLLVFTPVYARYLPLPGSRADARLSACKARAAAIASARPRTGSLDLRVDGLKVRDAANFGDETHFDAPIARDVEAAIAQRIEALLKPESN